MRCLQDGKWVMRWNSTEHLTFNLIKKDDEQQAQITMYNVAKRGIFYKIVGSAAAQARAAKYMQILSLLYPEVVSFPQ